MKNMFQGFKDFISRGNAIEMAIGIVIGIAFGAVITALNNGLISPLIGWVLGSADLSSFWTITLPAFSGRSEAAISVGLIINALVVFLITAAAIYFLVVVPLNKLAERRKRGEEAEPAAPAEDVLLLQEIRDLLANRTSPAIVNDAGVTPGASALPPSIPPGT